ncbi:MAG: hypothetical protein LBG90_05770 [Spirochaetaceae bacterium]|nr:hypothetical protein [Spirochaetaceae bacterium]
MALSKICPADYDDAVSDILLKLFQKIEKYNSVYALSTWVYAVAGITPSIF